MVRFDKRRRRAGRPMLFAPGPRAAARQRTSSSNAHARTPRSLGAVTEPVTLQVRALQQALVRAGYDVGPTGVDNRWGPNTQAAFRRFLSAIGHSGEPPIEVYEATQTLALETAVWNRLGAAAPGSGGERQSSSSSGGGGTRTTSTTDPGSAVEQLDAEAAAPWWQSPWLWGGVALVVTGAVVFYATAEDDDPEDEWLEGELLPAF